MVLDSFTLSRIFFILILGFFLEWYSSESVQVVSSVLELRSFSSLPVAFELVGIVSNVHYSGGALVFELEKEGVLTCYFRHPPSNLFVFNQEIFLVRGRLEQTPKGLLCIVEKMVFFPEE